MENKCNSPRISVVIPVYQVEQYIANALHSVLNQTYRDYEIILVDDGTKDNSIQIAEQVLSETFAEYRIIHLENSGQGAARNAGFKAARGEWLFFLDSDDVIQPYCFSLFMWAITQEPDADLVFSDFQYVYDAPFKEAKELRKYTCFDKDEGLIGFLHRKIVPLVPGSLFRNKFLTRYNITHKEIRWSEDQYFMWRVLSHARKTIYVHAVTYNYFKHPNSIMTSTPLNRIEEAYRAFEELPNTIDHEVVRRYLVPRWVFGCLRRLAFRNDDEMWREAFLKLEGKKNLKALIRFPEIKIRILSGIGVINSKVLYLAFRRT